MNYRLLSPLQTHYYHCYYIVLCGNYIIAIKVKVKNRNSQRASVLLSFNTIMGEEIVSAKGDPVTQFGYKL